MHGKKRKSRKAKAFAFFGEKGYLNNNIIDLRFIS